MDGATLISEMAFCHCCLNSNLETETNVLICLESLFLAGGTYNFGNKQTPNAPHILSSFVTVKHSNCIIIWYLFQQNIKLFIVGYVIGYVSKSKKKFEKAAHLMPHFCDFIGATSNVLPWKIGAYATLLKRLSGS